MCCITTLVLVFISRIGILYWWLTDPQRFAQAFEGWILPGFVLPTWAWALLGGIFLPWTTLAYLYVSPGGVMGYEWIVLGAGLLVDLAGHGGSYRHRNRVPGYRRGQSY
ncbi:MAG: hypothetical protein PHQ40_17715 [Anaerolineaceae bacterium]|nr:hypothetical protein [Anaerolineaceae bacterium]